MPHPYREPQARDQAAKAVNVSGRTIDNATRVIEDGVPELAEAVDKGEIKVTPAAEIARLSTREAYLDLMEKLYNFKRKSLFPLKHKVEVAMRERNPFVADEDE